MSGMFTALIIQIEFLQRKEEEEAEMRRLEAEAEAEAEAERIRQEEEEQLVSPSSLRVGIFIRFFILGGFTRRRK